MCSNEALQPIASLQPTIPSNRPSYIPTLGPDSRFGDSIYTQAGLSAAIRHMEKKTMAVSLSFLEAGAPLGMIHAVDKSNEEKKYITLKSKNEIETAKLPNKKSKKDLS